MMECQKEQGSIPNLDIFLHSPSAGSRNGGFVWWDTTEGHIYWYNQIEKLRNHTLYKQYKNDWR